MISVLTAALLTIAASACVTAAVKPKSTPTPIPVIQIPVSGVNIGHMYIDEAGHFPEECIQFTNTSADAETYVLLGFAWSSPNDKGEDEEFIGTHALSPGAATADMCRLTSDYSSKVGWRVTAFATNVHYQGGGVWQLVPPVPIADGGAQNVPVRISFAEAYFFSTSMPTGQLIGYPYPQECVQLDNTSPVSVVHVRVVFRHIDPNGSELGDEPFDIRSTLAPNTKGPLMCRNFKATIEPGLLYYARAEANGAAVGRPVVIYDNKPSTLSAEIAEVDFANRQ